MRPKPVVGQTLYSLNIGNAARGKEQTLTPVVVTIVGRKYFKCDKINGYREVSYSIDDWSQITEYSPDSCLYESEQEFFDEKEATRLAYKISKHFDYGGKHCNLSLKKLRAIEDIIDRDENCQHSYQDVPVCVHCGHML